MGIEDGGVVKAKKEGNKRDIDEIPLKSTAPYRVFDDAEIEEFL